MHSGAPDPPDPDEPRRVAQAAATLRLAYVVITSVTRDDLPDGGAAHFSETIRAVRHACPHAGIEVLTPDFAGDPRAVSRVLQEHPTVFNHNIETVARLTPVLRTRATYHRSLAVLEHAGRCAPDIPRKSGLMVGAGETAEEVRQALFDLRRVGCSIVTIGQYVPPSSAHHPLRQRVSSASFQVYEQMARACGFVGIACGPLVRSSYHAAQTFAAARSHG
jgi:lipoic acid synthetase